MSAEGEFLFPLRDVSGDSMSRETPFRYLMQVGPGHWNIRGSLTMACGLIDVGTHMSLLKLKSGKFLAIDTINLKPEMKSEVDILTVNGTLIDACIATHPFHTLFFKPFAALYPGVKLVGTPRHIRMFPELTWDGATIDTRLDDWKAQGVEMRIPAGAEFIKPTDGNHFSCVFVFHQQSRTLFVDDTLMFISPSHSGRCLSCCLPCLASKMLLHVTAFDGDMNTGLIPQPESVDLFLAWMHNVLEDWDFDTLCTAHTGNKVGGAKEAARNMLKGYEESFAKLKQNYQKLAGDMANLSHV